LGSPGRKRALYNLEVFRLRFSLLHPGMEMGRVLETLREAGVFFTASEVQAPDRRSLAGMRKNCLPKLADGIRLLAPCRIVAMGRFASSSVCEILNLSPPPSLDKVSASRWQGVRFFFTPHPICFQVRSELSPQLSGILVER
jgi:hypothetical protein